MLMPCRLASRIAAVALACIVAACGGGREPETVEPVAPAKPPAALKLSPTVFADLQGWSDGDPRLGLLAYSRSCAKMARYAPETAMGRQAVFGAIGPYQRACDALDREPWQGSAEQARAFVERHFAPFVVAAGNDREGLFTGYYEPELAGSLVRGGAYQTPLHGIPADLIKLDLSAFDSSFEGRVLRGRIDGNSFLPYPDRADIDRGAIQGQAPVLAYVSDPAEKFFLQIQGSGIVRLPDGQRLRVGYAEQNGRAYRAIGRDLIEMGELTSENVSLQSIRAWLDANPARADALMHKNGSYVFFRMLEDLDPNAGPPGAQGVQLTEGHSLAVDRSYIPLGLPMWLETSVPVDGVDRPVQRMVVAQDTGGAIKGIVRGDLFWGAGAAAEALAGPMQEPGRYIALLPRDIAATS